MTRRRAPREAGEAFRVARDIVAPKTGLASVQAGWSQAVGEQIAEVAQPISERAGTLTVECTNAMWAQELDLMQGAAVGAAARGPGGEGPGSAQVSGRTRVLRRHSFFAICRQFGTSGAWIPGTKLVFL